MRILFASVIYEGMEKFIDNFLSSLKSQDYKFFDIYIINDYCSEAYRLEQSELNLNGKLDIYNITYKANASQLRKKIINYALSMDYDLLIFGDSDDLFSNNRIGDIVKVFSNDFGFYYNTLLQEDTLVDFFGNKLPEEVYLYDTLDKYNFIGMSNSAINLKVTKSILWQIGDVTDCIAFDWYLYTLLLKNKSKGKLVSSAKTYYRIYESNIAGSTKTLTEAKLDLGIRVKKCHYNLLRFVDNGFIIRGKKMLELENRLRDKGFKNEYIKVINSTFNTSYFWWENIKCLDEVKKYL